LQNFMQCVEKERNKKYERERERICDQDIKINFFNIVC